jgi:hypothetical protein
MYMSWTILLAKRKPKALSFQKSGVLGYFVIKPFVLLPNPWDHHIINKKGFCFVLLTVQEVSDLNWFAFNPVVRQTSPHDQGGKEQRGRVGILLSPWRTHSQWPRHFPLGPSSESFYHLLMLPFWGSNLTLMDLSETFKIQTIADMKQCQFLFGFAYPVFSAPLIKFIFENISNCL